MKQAEYEELAEWEREELEGRLEAEKLQAEEARKFHERKEWLEERLYESIDAIDKIKLLLNNELEYSGALDGELNFLKNIMREELRDLIKG